MPLSILLHPRSGTPVYLQIVQQVERAVSIGLLRPGEQLPTVKQLASDLLVNPSTAAKAIRELERAQIVRTNPGRGSYVSENAKTLAAQQTAQSTVRDAVERAVSEAHALGIDGADVLAIFECVFSAHYRHEDSGATSA